MAKYSRKFGVKNSKMFFSPGGIAFLMAIPNNKPIYRQELAKISNISERDISRKIKMFIEANYIEVEDVTTNNAVERKIKLTELGAYVRSRLEKLVEATKVADVAIVTYIKTLENDEK